MIYVLILYVGRMFGRRLGYHYSTIITMRVNEKDIYIVMKRIHDAVKI